MRFRSAPRRLKMISLTREDLPEPDTPVTQVNVPRGKGRPYGSQVVLRVPPNGEELCPLPVRRRAGDRNFLAPERYWPVMDAGDGHDLLCGACGDDLAAVDPGGRADIHNVVGGPHGVLVVLHHDQGIAQIPQALEGSQQLVVVPLVQADGGLVQNIQHPHQAAADLRGQTDTLALPAGQGTGLERVRVR